MAKDEKRGSAENLGVMAGVVGTVLVGAAMTQAPKIAPQEEAPPPSHTQKLGLDPNAPKRPFAETPVPDNLKPKVPGR
ncbi:MAG: hypothetical protein K2Q01_05965 [Rickettsiales bacterium]|nr:hypothetical protein [Rickettsiales bacterium]